MSESHASLPLRDIIAPIDQGWWPPAPGWWLVAVFILFLMWILTHRLAKYFTYEFAALRKAALSELAGLQNQSALSDRRFTERVSSLLKRVAIARYAEHQPAQLSGNAWVAFLDKTSSAQRFSQAGGAVIGHAQYQGEAKIDRYNLILAARAWIKSI